VQRKLPRGLKLDVYFDDTNAFSVDALLLPKPAAEQAGFGSMEPAAASTERCPPKTRRGGAGRSTSPPFAGAEAVAAGGADAFADAAGGDLVFVEEGGGEGVEAIELQALDFGPDKSFD
jgi:hypothetical protein